MQSRIEKPDLICLSHLRWDFVYQRPQHLMMRCAQARRVFFVEEPIFDVAVAECEVIAAQPNLWVVKPHLPRAFINDAATVSTGQRNLLELVREKFSINNYWLWYYTPMALVFTAHLQPQLIVYDCMDELSAFRGAPPELVAREAELFQRADLIFTGGHSLFEAKQKKHSQVYEFPSSVDVAHFAAARTPQADPPDQAAIPHPRLGFFGVIDERMDLDLIAGIAEARPDWHLMLLGPVVKINPATLPMRENIHYLGGKSYEALPQYLGGWDVALLPFARNEATRFISPTKTPEYLAGGKPVVSTAIRDVIHPYGEMGLVRIAESVPDFIAAVAAALQTERNDPTWLARVDSLIGQFSWDRTWQAMAQLMEEKDRLRYIPEMPIGHAAQTLAMVE